MVKIWDASRTRIFWTKKSQWPRYLSGIRDVSADWETRDKATVRIDAVLPMGSDIMELSRNDRIELIQAPCKDPFAYNAEDVVVSFDPIDVPEFSCVLASSEPRQPVEITIRFSCRIIFKGEN